MIVKNIYDKVADIMDSLTGAGQPLAKAYSYPEAKPDLFPCSIMDLSAEILQEDLASRTKWLTVNVIVRVIMRQKNTEQATLQRIDILDLILDRFRDSDVYDDLGGVADIADISSVTPIFVVDSEQLFGFDIVVTAKKVVSVN